MGEEVVSEYLRSKLRSILSDVDYGIPRNIMSRLISIETQVNSTSPVKIVIPVDLMYELIELVSERRVFILERRTAAASKKGFGLFFPKRLLHTLSEWMFNKRMKRRLDSIERKIKGCTASQEPSQPPAPIFEETRPIEDPSLIIGFEAEAEKIEAWLMSSQEGKGSGMVGIVGRCGCGKTALAQKVFDSPRIVEEFSTRVWICLSNMLLDGGWREVNSTSNQLYDLLGKIQRGQIGKRYLVVLDNAWLLDEWYGQHLLDRLSGDGAVIVTSRREDVIRRMVGDDRYVLRLQAHLSDEQIFSKVVQQQGKLDPTHPNLTSIRDHIKRNFDGLPLAAKTLADILPHLQLKTCWLRARDLIIKRGDDDTYWRWTFLPPPQEMEEVAEVVGDFPYMSIIGSVELKELVVDTSYSAYLVFKLKTKKKASLPELAAIAEVRIECDGESSECTNERVVNLVTGGMQRKWEDEEGWMEIKLGDIITTSGDDGRFFRAALYASTYSCTPPYPNVTFSYSGLVVKGIEFRRDYV